MYVSTALSGCGGSSERLVVIEERNGKILCCLKVEWVVVSCYVKSVLVFKRSMAIVLGVITQPWFWTCWWEGSSGGCIPAVSRTIPSSCGGNLQLETVPAVLWVAAATAQGEEEALPTEVKSVRPSMRLVIWFSLLETFFFFFPHSCRISAPSEMLIL